MYYRTFAREQASIDLQIRTLERGRPWLWLKQGWEDMKRAPALSIGYGLVFVAAGYVLTFGLAWAGLFFLVPPLTAGFFLVAPLLAIGLYEVSRHIERGERPTLHRILTGWRRNDVSIATMGVLLMVIFLVWMMLSQLAFAITFHQITPTWENFIPVVFLFTESWPFAVTYIGVGAVVAALTFAITAFGVPLLLDREIDTMNAVFASWAAVRANLVPMALWAALIVALVGVGLLTMFIGLAVAMPWIGFATWHAYRDTIS